MNLTILSSLSTFSCVFCLCPLNIKTAEQTRFMAEILFVKNLEFHNLKQKFVRFDIVIYQNSHLRIYQYKEDDILFNFSINMETKKTRKFTVSLYLIVNLQKKLLSSDKTQIPKSSSLYWYKRGHCIIQKLTSTDLKASCEKRPEFLSTMFEKI